MRNVLLTTTMLATLSIAPTPIMAQDQSAPSSTTLEAAPQGETLVEVNLDQQPPVELAAVYERYAAALLAYRQFGAVSEQQGNGQAKGYVALEVDSPEEAMEIVMETGDRLAGICEQLGTPDIATCLDRFIPSGQRLPNDVRPLEGVEQASAAEMTRGDEVTDGADGAQVEAENTAETETQGAGAASPQSDAGSDQMEMSDAEQPNADTAAETEGQVDAEASSDAAGEAVNAEGQATAQADIAAETPTELIAAYESYVAARLDFVDARTSGEDTAAAGAVQSSRQHLEELCTEFGSPDLATCVDRYIPVEMRLPDDLAPLAINADSALIDSSAEAQAPASEKSGDQVATGSDSDAPSEPVEPIEGDDVAAEDVAPVLDSAKEATSAPAEAGAAATTKVEGETSGEAELKQTDEAASATESNAPPPKDDADAQADAAPTEIKSITAEDGEPVSKEEQAETSGTRAAPQQAKVVEEDRSDFRIVFQFNNQTFVESKDNARLEQGADDIYVERLSNGRTRETILRADGSEVVTIYNRNGDIVRRSRFTPEGEEIVLVYVDEAYQDDLLEWRDPAEQLGPLRLDIALSDYVLDADEADEEELVQFFEQPPVERVQRLYSINEVKRSARLRDMVRRLEIGGLTFATDKATVAPDQISSLAHVADAMLDLLEDNPAETFLIEGHTDAVGDEIYNLKLSDRRAETVAVLLTQVFGVPPENLATQGYGERYLKVRTEQPERRNRRVTIKRITPLVSPVARR
ncbi:OmpA family protein [Maritalea mediterranea]|uniref:OmpA family protein n=1 Tax=Maritalea mediterranea TaxID=2909667 RepID=A0ABS9E967_9HYPH|nr:OmpA family protein [Maritalea mediterranea]MCF4099432.1 OmpA family protein [Maritalea mediterranea]